MNIVNVFHIGDSTQPLYKKSVKQVDVLLAENPRFSTIKQCSQDDCLIYIDFNLQQYFVAVIKLVICYKKCN